MKIIFFIVISLVSSNILIPSYSEKDTQDFSVGKVEWSEKCHPLVFNTGLVRVADPDMNLDPNAKDKLEIKVWSDFTENDQLEKILTLNATETDNSTGIFESTVFFGDPWDDSSGYRIPIWNNTTVTALYVDHTLPTDISEMSITDSLIIKDIKPTYKKLDDGTSAPHYTYDSCTMNFLDDSRYQFSQKIAFIYPSPSKQLENGVPFDKVKCKNGLDLVQKASDESLVCVKPETKQILIERGWADSSGNILKQRSSQTIHDLTEKSERIITGMVTDKETIGNTTMIWVGVYEWLKKNPNYDSIILDITKYSSESSLDFQKGDELLLFLKDIDLQNGHFSIFYLDSETKPEKYPLDMKEYVDSFVKPEDKGRQYLYQENENCKNITWENDSFLYCTYLEEEFRYYIPILVTVDRVKQKMLHQVSEEYFAEHLDLRRAYDTAIVNGHTIPTGQDLEFDYKIGNQKFLYRVSVSGNDEAYISYFHPREIESLPYENRINELVQTCLERGSYPIFWDRVAVSHVEKGFTPMITGGTPAIYDRYGNAVLHHTKQQFRLWPETGEIECSKGMQDFGSNPIEQQQRELLIDATEFLKIKNRK